MSEEKVYVYAVCCYDGEVEIGRAEVISTGPKYTRIENRVGAAAFNCRTMISTEAACFTEEEALDRFMEETARDLGAHQSAANRLRGIRENARTGHVVRSWERKVTNG